MVLGQCGINIKGQSLKLKVNYRTTDETRKFATNILNNIEIDNLDGGIDNNKGYKSLTHGPSPQIIECKNSNEEAKKIIKLIKKLTDDNSNLANICITARTKKLVKHYKDI